jgi:predicted SAM-dependent methyltransferase
MSIEVARIIMATDTRQQSLSATATAINSIRLNCQIPVHVRVYVRDAPCESFSVDGLQVDFIDVSPGLRRSGDVPRHVNAEATFDRIAGARMSEDWDSALILDFDQIAIGDVTDLFRFDLSGCLAAGRMWNRSLGEAVGEWFGRSLPAAWQHLAGYRYFYMGPLLNLAAMREAGSFEIFDRFHKDAGMEEQIALHAALGNRVKDLPPVYNTVPQWDGVSGDSRILHFTGPAKPWSNPTLRGAGYWNRYATTMEVLSRGQHQGDHGPRRLHLGCGYNPIPGWENVDIDPALADAKQVDLTAPLPYLSDSIELIYCEHVIEHLDLSGQQRLLEECARILKPGGALRLVTPDLEALAAELTSPTPLGTKYCEWAANAFPWGVQEPRMTHVLNHMMRAWGHRFIHSRTSLSGALVAAGFPAEGIRAGGLDDTDIPEFNGLANTGRMPPGLLEFESFSVEARLPDGGRGAAAKSAITDAERLFGCNAGLLKTDTPLGILHVQACLPHEPGAIYRDIFPNRSQSLVWLDPFEDKVPASDQEVSDHSSANAGEGLVRLEGDALMALTSLVLEDSRFDFIYFDLEVAGDDLPYWASLIGRLTKHDGVLVVRRPLAGNSPVESGSLCSLLLATQFSDTGRTNPSILRRKK